MSETTHDDPWAPLSERDRLALSAVVHQNYYMPDLFETVAKIVRVWAKALDDFDALAAELRQIADKCSTEGDWEAGEAAGWLAASNRAAFKARLARRLIEDRDILAKLAENEAAR